MKRFLFILGVFEACFLLQGTVRHFPINGLRVDLFWLLVLYFGFFVPLFPGGVAVFFMGLAEEALGVPLHGVLCFSYLLIYLFLRMTHQHLFFERGGSQVTWVVLLTLAQKGIEQGLLVWQGYPLLFDPLRLLSATFLMGLLSLPLFSFLRNPGRIIRHAT